MEIGLWSDAVNHPSLPLMKISAYHKARGDNVRLVQSPLERFDVAYCSKTFNLPNILKIPKLEYIPLADEIHMGGSGFAIEVENGRETYNRSKDNDLPSEIEHINPDYGLYPDYCGDRAFGFLTRGCPCACDFCIVTPKEGAVSVQTADLSEFWHGQREIHLMDANLLACADRVRLLETLAASKSAINYTQGLDARFIDEDLARLICETRIKMVHFAFDQMAHEAAIVKGLTVFRKHFSRGDRYCKVYILTNFNTTPAEDWYKVRKVIELGYQADVRIYQKGTQSQFLTDLARWANNSYIYRSCEFADYVPRTDGMTCRELYGKIIEGR